MATNNDDQTSMNPFVQALRGNDDNGDEEQGAPAPDEKPIVSATMEAMSIGDNGQTVANRMASPEASPAMPAVTPPQDSGRMEAVVDLLFGNHLNEMNASMRTLEKQVAERVSKAESEMRTRIESLDRHTKGEIDTLTKSLDKERGTRDDVVAKIGDRVETAIQQMEARLEKMENQFIRSHEMAQKDVSERLTKASDATMLLRKGMEQEIANMKVSLSTRAELGTMFAELGKRLETNASGSGLGGM